MEELRKLMALMDGIFFKLESRFLSVENKL